MTEQFPTNEHISHQHKFDMRRYIALVAIQRFDIFADSPDEATPTAGGNQAGNLYLLHPEPPEDLIA
jgi:hypothetical protein